VNRPIQIDDLSQAVLPDRALHLAIGMFDGVHLGHRAVVGAAVTAARHNAGLPAVLTFWPHPSIFFHAAQPTRLIMLPAEKVRTLGAIGVEAIITLNFTEEFARIPAEEFLPYLRQRLPRLAGVYVGDNWRFGRGRSGDSSLLVREGEKLGLSVTSVPRISLAGEPVSSTRIRELLQAGEMASANTLLGAPYAAQGLVVPGRHLGRDLGFPTLNLAWRPDLQPRFGVYAVRLTGVKTAEALPGVANYGLRPTVDTAAEARLEIHLLADCPYGPGDEVRVEWLDFVRPEMKFSGLEELRAQISRDRAAVAADFSLR
jgi:riboflavin kinase/FMN adenylyltransferase